MDSLRPQLVVAILVCRAFKVFHQFTSMLYLLLPRILSTRICLRFHGGSLSVEYHHWLYAETAEVVQPYQHEIDIELVILEIRIYEILGTCIYLNNKYM